jgi:signal transduction histidine kinase
LRLQQVRINPGGNGLKFTERGEVVVSVPVPVPVPVLARWAVAVTLGFAVRDIGIGIAAENQARIYSAITQAEASTTRRCGGTRLAVAISQRLVQRMGGELRLDSALGLGSSFAFDLTLPIAPDHAATPPPPQGEARRWPARRPSPPRHNAGCSNIPATWCRSTS